MKLADAEKKCSNGFLVEVARFSRTMFPQKVERTSSGLLQFRDWESNGQKPRRPSKFFRFLLDGKRWWEWTLNEYRGLYGTKEWPGWLCLYEDFVDDRSGFIQLCQRMGADGKKKVEEMERLLQEWKDYG